ncbi:MAG TPA: ATP-binding protein, partial [Anaerolineae bacterium]
TGDVSEHDAPNFFRLGNLTALREMALRLTAERVDQQLRNYMQVKHITGPWKSGERLMVAVSASPLSERLVRWTRRMAYNLDAPWIAVYVETSHELTESEKVSLAQGMALARELGAEVVTTSDENVPRALLRVARQRNVTQIVVGKPERGFVKQLFGRARVVNKLIRESGDVDIYVVTGDQNESPSRPIVIPWETRPEWQQYLIMLAVVAITTVINFIALPYIGYRSVALVYIFVVSLLALFAGRGPVFVAAAVSAILWDFLYIPPRFTIWISQFEDVLMFAMYFTVALITGTLTSRLRAQEKAVRHREERATAMYTLVREVVNAITMDEVLRTAVEQISQAFNADVAFLLASPDGHLAEQSHSASTLILSPDELHVASFAYEKRKTAGRFTDTLPKAEAEWLPLRAQKDVVGVMGLRTHEGRQLSTDQQMLLETFARQVALAIERERLDEAAEHTRVVLESERLYKTLLNSVSHELRTPIATITGAASSLQDDKINHDPARWSTVVNEIQGAANRLNRVVENLLGMTRVESGRLKPKLEWCDVSDLISVTVNRMKPDFTQHELVVDVASDLPLVQIDFVMMEQALLNLLHNAVVHTPPGTRVRVTARVDGNDLLLVVADRGPGLPPADIDRVFDKFYRAPGAKPGGTGLGLSISKGLVETHGGTIKAENRANGGARFLIRLPIGTPPEVPQEGSE